MTKRRPKISKISVISSPTATTKITLFCLVHGKPPSSFFSVTVGNHENINGLRKLIKKESELYLNNFAHWQLKLWVVDIPINSQNLGDSNVSIANVLKGQEFLLPNKVGDIFTTQPNEDNIHIIVELPAFPTSSTAPVPSEAPLETTEGESSYKRSIDTFFETTQQFANILDRQTKKPKVSLSSMNQTHLDELLNYLNFRRATSVITVNPTNKNFDDRFVWDERAKNQHAEDQKDSQDRVIKRGYMNYLCDNISVPSTLVWYDPKSKRDLLNITDVSLPYSISGTADVLVMDESFHSVRDYRSGIRAVFEIKKTVQDNHVNQAIAELIATNILSNYAIFVILTDLNNDWTFYWLSNGSKIMMYRAVNSSNALDIIERALTEDPITITTIDPSFTIGERINCFRRSQRSQVEASENEMGLDTFFNRPKVQFEFEDDVGNMKDMFDEMTDKEIKDWKVRRALKLLGETPGFQLDKDYMNMYS